VSLRPSRLTDSARLPSALQGDRIEVSYPAGGMLVFGNDQLNEMGCFPGTAAVRPFKRLYSPDPFSFLFAQLFRFSTAPVKNPAVVPTDSSQTARDLNE